MGRALHLVADERQVGADFRIPRRQQPGAAVTFAIAPAQVARL